MEDCSEFAVCLLATCRLQIAKMHAAAEAFNEVRCWICCHSRM